MSDPAAAPEPADNLRADIAAVVDAAEARQEAPAQANSRLPRVAKAEAPPVKQDAPSEDGRGEPQDRPAEPANDDSRAKADTKAPRERDPVTGKFVKAEGGDAQAFTPRAKNPERASEPPAHADEEHATEDDPDLAHDEANEPADEPAIDAPHSWSAAEKEHWAKLPRSLQQTIARRESDIQRGFQQRAEQLRTLEPLAQAIEPYRESLALRGVHPAAMVGQLMAVADLCQRDPMRGVAHVAQLYGVDLRQYAAAFEQATKPQDPAVSEANQRIARLEQFLQRSHQAAEQAEMGRITTEVEGFRADSAAHPYFEDVRPAMAQLMASNVCATLQEAYDHACWANPDVRRRMQEAERNAEQARLRRAEKDAAERARRAGVSVTGHPGGNGARPPPKAGSVREALESAWNAVASR